MGLYLLSMALLSTTVCVCAQPLLIGCDEPLDGCGLAVGSDGQSALCTCFEFVPQEDAIIGTAFCDFQDLIGDPASCCECRVGMSSTWADSGPDPRNCTSKGNLRELKRIVRGFKALGKKIRQHPAPDCISDSVKQERDILSQKLIELNEDIKLECGFVSASESSSQSCD